jgi:hypothetical protein
VVEQAIDTVEYHPLSEGMVVVFANCRRRGFGLFEFLVLSLVAAVTVGAIIGLATRAGQAGRSGDCMSLGPSIQPRPSSDTVVGMSPPDCTAHCPPSAGEVVQRGIGGSVCSPGVVDVA